MLQHLFFKTIFINQLKQFIMNAIIGLGKYLYAIPFAIFGIFHFMGASDMAAMAPFGGEIMVYFTGACHLAAAVAILIGKYDKLASVLLALMLLIFAFAVHVPAISAENQEMMKVLTNFALAGGALMYASSMAKDNSIIG